MSKPRVHAHHETSPEQTERRNGNELQTPRALVHVDFTLGDHDVALRDLDNAVAGVRRQIEATAHETPRHASVRVHLDGRDFEGVVQRAAQDWMTR